MIKSSLYWIQHFKQNATKHRVNWNQKPAITAVEQNRIIESLKAWQLGETSDGKHLLAASTMYALKINDPHYVEAVQLFIKEEQKHGANLGRYIDLLGESRKQKDWGDTLFRKIRYFNTSMELWTITVIIVESAAQVYYQAIQDATQCKLLKEICSDILQDEAHHIKFQNERLWILFQQKSFYFRAFAVTWYCLLFFGTIHAVWFAHKRALKAGGVNMDSFMRQMYHKFFKTIQFVHAKEQQERITAVELG